MRSRNIIAVTATALLVSTSAMALRTTESEAVRSRPAAQVIGHVLDRNTRAPAKEVEKRERREAKELRKLRHREQKAERERLKDERKQAKRGVERD